MTQEQCLTCGEWFEDSEMDAHLSEHLNEPESEEQEERLPVTPPLPPSADFDHKSESSYSTTRSPEETLARAAMQLRSSGYIVRVEGSTLRAVHGGPSWTIIIALISVSLIVQALPFNFVWVLDLTLLIPIPVYAFGSTNRKKRIVMTLDRGQFDIRYIGSNAAGDVEQLSKFLRE